MPTSSAVARSTKRDENEKLVRRLMWEEEIAHSPPSDANMLKPSGANCDISILPGSLVPSTTNVTVVWWISLQEVSGQSTLTSDTGTSGTSQSEPIAVCPNAPLTIQKSNKKNNR